MSGIPERKSISDQFSGYVVRIEGHDLLADFPYADADIVADGDFVIRYGIPFLGKSHICIVPDLIALEYGDILTGESAWRFLIKRSNLYPRADVIGYRNNGEDEMIIVKKLDLAAPIQILVYPDVITKIPISQPKALITQNIEGTPDRLLEYSAYYETINDWQITLNG